jgi:hypothetical protein
MSFCEENRFQPKLICNKGDILLSEIKNSNYNTRSYILIKIYVSYFLDILC